MNRTPFHLTIGLVLFLTCCSRNTDSNIRDVGTSVPRASTQWSTVLIVKDEVYDSQISWLLIDCANGKVTFCTYHEDGKFNYYSSDESFSQMNMIREIDVKSIDSCEKHLSQSFVDGSAETLCVLFISSDGVEHAFNSSLDNDAAKLRFYKCSDEIVSSLRIRSDVELAFAMGSIGCTRAEIDQHMFMRRVEDAKLLLALGRVSSDNPSAANTAIVSRAYP
jgi:hypothetical protein